jgi:hypothetical protein
MQARPRLRLGWQSDIVGAACLSRIVNDMKPYWLVLAPVLFATQALANDVRLLDISDALGPKSINDQVGEVRIVSQSNTNKRYYLDIRARHTFSASSRQILLTVGEQKVRFNSEGKIGTEVTSIGAIVEDPTIIPQIAEQFHATVLNRRHPGYQMLVEFIPDKPEFTAGEPVVVTLRITNVGQRDFAFVQGGRQRGARDNQFDFSARRNGGIAVPDSGNPLHFGGLGSTVKLKPSENHEIKVDLTKWFEFEPNSHYQLRGSYYLRFVDPDTTSYDTVWEDYACAEFTLRTKRQQKD